MIAFVDEHRDVHGVEPICRLLPIAPSTYYEHVARWRDPAKLSARAKRDAELCDEIQRVREENVQVYGLRKVWWQLRRKGIEVARCTVTRLMLAMGLRGVLRGKSVRTTMSDKAAPCPPDRVNRDFRAPRANIPLGARGARCFADGSAGGRWVADFTYVATWAGFVHVAFVVDAFARRIVGERVSRTATASFVLNALEQALHARQPVEGGHVHHRDRGVQGALVRVVHEPGIGVAVRDGHAQRRQRQFLLHACGHGPTDHLAGKQVQHDGLGRASLPQSAHR